MNISFELDRFVLAQDQVYETVCDELRRGRKSLIGCGTSFRR